MITPVNDPGVVSVRVVLDPDVPALNEPVAPYAP